MLEDTDLSADERSAVEALLPVVTFTAGGVTWVETPRDSTAEHDVYVMRHVRASGLDQIGIDAQQVGGDVAAAQAAIDKMVDRILESGRYFDLLAGFLVQSGEEWSPDAAVVNAGVLRKIRDTDAKREMTRAMGRLLLTFSLAATGSSLTSETSSPKPGSGMAAIPEAPSPTSEVVGVSP